MQDRSEQESWQAFIRLCAQYQRPEELEELFEFFFTVEEKEDLAGRYSLVKALLEGKRTQREIAKQLALSISKITRGSNALKIVTPKLKKALREKMGIF